MYIGEVVAASSSYTELVKGFTYMFKIRNIFWKNFW